MPFVDWQLSLCKRLRVPTPRHASWPQASPSNPGRPHWWDKPAKNYLYFTPGSWFSASALFSALSEAADVTQPEELAPNGIDPDVAFFVGSVTDVAVIITLVAPPDAGDS